MKFKYLFLFIATLFSLSIYSQEYEPIIKEGSFWDMKKIVITSTCPENVEAIKRIQITGDTLINNKLYKKLKSVYLEDETDDLCITPHYFYNPENFISIKDQFIREDVNEKKLYILSKLENDFFEEFTVCDFSLKIGDELEDYFGYNNSNPDLQLVVEDIKIDENNRKVFYMNDGSFYTEGIGRNEGNLNIYFNLVDGTYERVHCNGDFYNSNNCAIISENHYEPMLKEGAFWDTLLSDRDGFCEYNRIRIKIGTDTIINNRTYKKFRVANIHGSPNKSFEFCEDPPYYVKENEFYNFKNEYISEDVENQKIYLWTTREVFQQGFFQNEDASEGKEFKEYILFDFKAKKGEIFSNFLRQKVREITTNAKGQKVIITENIYFSNYPNDIESIRILFTTFNLGVTNRAVSCYGYDGSQNNCATILNTKNYESSNIKAFPNPVTDILQITNIKNVTVTIFSIDGKVLKKEKFGNKIQIDMSTLTQGIYFVEVSNLKSKKRLKILKL